jgi:hypothetical protein
MIKIRKAPVNLGKQGILFEQRNARKDMGWANAHNPFFCPRKARKARKTCRVAAQTDGMACGLKGGATVPVVMVPLVFSC